jgi:hypothetical protein
VRAHASTLGCARTHQLFWRKRLRREPRREVRLVDGLRARAQVPPAIDEPVELRDARLEIRVVHLAHGARAQADLVRKVLQRLVPGRDVRLHHNPLARVVLVAVAENVDRDRLGRLRAKLFLNIYKGTS